MVSQLLPGADWTCNINQALLTSYTSEAHALKLCLSLPWQPTRNVTWRYVNVYSSVSRRYPSRRYPSRHSIILLLILTLSVPSLLSSSISFLTPFSPHLTSIIMMLQSSSPSPTSSSPFHSSRSFNFSPSRIFSLYLHNPILVLLPSPAPSSITSSFTCPILCPPSFPLSIMTFNVPVY